ncbi:MAG: M56 family metallopeptidase [Limisphaerales bacterium]
MNTLIESLNHWGSSFTGFALPMLVQSGLLIAVLLTVNVLLRKRVRATVRYALWMLVLVKLVLPPSLTSPTSLAYWFPVRVSPERVATGTAAASPATASMVVTKADASLLPSPVGSALSRPALTRGALLCAGWLAGLVCLVAWVCRRSLFVARMLSETTEPSNKLQKLLESCRRQLGITRAISLRITSTAGSPAICGLFKPVILIPSFLPETLTESGMRSVLLHELAHYRRSDLWIGHAQTVLQLFYWYNPLLWLANNAIRRVREQAVDEMVLVEMQEEAEAYPATLLQVAKLAQARPALSLGLVGILEPGSGLKERIHHILLRPLPRTARVGVRGLLLVGLIAVVILPMACKQQATPNPAERPVDKINTGLKLSGEQAKDLEAKVKTNPEDESARSQLLAYYLTEQYRSAAARKARQGHILWLIEHHPETQIRDPHIRLDRILDGAAYESGKTLWLKQVQDHPQNLAILDHVAAFLLLQDRSTAEELLKKAQILEPSNPHWSERLAELYALNSHFGGTNAGAAAGQALAEMEKAAANTKDGNFSNLENLAKMAFAAGELDKAGTYAKDLLQQAPQHRTAWNYGNAIHRGNLILGRIAVREGRLAEAREYLLEAGKTPGSPQLDSFGPNMSLAKDLLEKGEKETVLAYLKLCGVFWTMGASRLDAWTKEVTDGQVPDFGANLVY